MIPYQDALLEKIQDAVCDFIDFTDNEVNTFTVTVEITADDGIVFRPKIIEKGGNK
jgi:hypothetical protein